MEAYKILILVYNGFRLANLSKRKPEILVSDNCLQRNCAKIQMIPSDDLLRNSGILVLLNKEKIPELHNSEILFSFKIPSYENLKKR